MKKGELRTSLLGTFEHNEKSEKIVSQTARTHKVSKSSRNVGKVINRPTDEPGSNDRVPDEGKLRERRF